jgi:hypothetical protein
LHTAAWYACDAQGRMASMTNWSALPSTGARVTTWTYDAYRGWLNNKRYPDSTGPDYTYTAGGRLKTRQWARIGTSSQRILTNYSFGYDNASRMTNVTDGTYSAGYSYLANLRLVSQITLKQSSTVRMTTAKQYDYLNRHSTASWVGYDPMETTIHIKD